MSATPVLAIVHSPRGWANALHRFVADHGGAHVRLRVVDVREAEHEPYDVLVCEDLTSFLTPRLVDRLHDQGRRLLGLHDPAEPHGAAVLRDLGVDEVATTDRDPADLLALAQLLAEGRDLAERVAAGPLDASGDGGDDAGPAGRRPVGGAGPDERGASGSSGVRGHVLAVGGPAGAPGATEVALALAAVAARRGERVALVDADEVAPALAQRIGLAPHPNLRAALDLARDGGAALAEALQDVPDVPGLLVLGGLPNVAAWADARPGDVVAVVAALAAGHDRVVVNVGPRLDELGERRRGHGRHGQTVAVLGACDDLVAVGLPTPLGVARLLDWIATARSLLGGAVDVAVNRCPRRGFVAAEVVREVRRSWDPEVLALLPEDARVAAAAWRGGVDGTRRWWRAVDELADGVLRGPVPVAERGPVVDGDAVLAAERPAPAGWGRA